METRSSQKRRIHDESSTDDDDTLPELPPTRLFLRIPLYRGPRKRHRTRTRADTTSTPGSTSSDSGDVDPANPSNVPQEIVLSTPNGEVQRAGSLPVIGSSPMSIMDPTPPRPRGGRPRVLKRTVTGRTPAAKQAKAERKVQVTENKAAEKAREAAAIELQRARAAKFMVAQAQKATQVLCQSEEDGGFGFKSIDDFMRNLMTPGDDPQFTANISRWCRDHGEDFARQIFSRAPEVGDRLVIAEASQILQREGQAIQNLLTRDSSTTVSEVLKTFSIPELSKQLQDIAPTLWRLLVTTATNPKQEVNETRRDKSLVSIIYYHFIQNLMTFM